MEMSTVLEGLDLLMTFSKCTAQTSEISPGAVTILPLSSLTGPFMFRCFPMISSVILQTALESPFLAASPIIAAFFSRKSRLSPLASLACLDVDIDDFSRLYRSHLHCLEDVVLISNVLQ